MQAVKEAKVQHIEFLAIFSAVLSPVRGWLQVRFLPHAASAAIFKKFTSALQEKNCLCSCGLRKNQASYCSVSIQSATVTIDHRCPLTKV